MLPRQIAETLSEALAGSILFGGIDTSKYEGDLVSLDIVPPAKGTPPSMSVQLTAISLSDGSSGNPIPILHDTVVPVVLDSGTTSIELPSALANQIGKFAGAVPIPPEPGYLFVPCNLSTSNANFTFTFGGSHGIDITIPMSEIVLDWQGDYTFEDGTRACELGINPTESLILGDVFLRNVYAVYNLEAKKIGLAQAKSNSPSSDTASSTGQIIEIPASGIPNAVRSASLLPTSSNTASAAAQPTGSMQGGKSGHSDGGESTAIADLATTLTIGTVSVLPSQASFSATGSAPPEPSIYLEAASVAQGDSSAGGASTAGATTASPTGPNSSSSGSGADITAAPGVVAGIAVVAGWAAFAAV